MNYALYLLVGLAAGFLSALLGIGGGVIMVPLLVLLLGADMKIAVGTSLAYIVPVALSGALQHSYRGQIMWKALLLVVPCGLIGTYLGVRASDVLSGPMLKRMFGVLMVVVGIKMALFAGGKPSAASDEPVMSNSAPSETQGKLIDESGHSS